MLRGSLQKRIAAILLLGLIESISFVVVKTATAQSDHPLSLQDVGTPAAKSVTFDFDHFPTGPVPDDFAPVLSGVGESVVWQIRAEPTARSGQKVLAQTSSEEVNPRFPLLIYKKLTEKNVEAGVSFKPLSGKVDQAGGLIVRYQDQDHFYVVSANALEDEVRLYKVIDGVRHPIAGANTHIRTGEWHWMKLIAQENHFQVFFEDILLFEADDTTYPQAGQIGLSTKSDGVTVFDDFYITPLG